jgi:hypothetical protein
VLKNGLYHENGEMIYYKDGTPKHAGVVQIENDIYYISAKGKAVKGRHVVHGEMANGILKRGTYTFGDDYKLVKGSYIAPKKKKVKKKPSISQKQKEKRDSFCRKLKQLKRKPVLISMLLLAVLLVTVVWVAEDGWISGRGDQDAAIPTLSDVRITLPQFEEDVLLCSPAAKLEYDGDLPLKTAVETGTPYRPFLFGYTLVNGTGTLLLGENEDFYDARQYPLEENEQYVSIDNLKVDTIYHYKVIVDQREYLGSFRTAPGTRYVHIPGLVNTRDIGGGVTGDGKTVKQGLLIRGVELDGLVNASYFIPEGELVHVKDTFGFVYDLDLRASSIYNGTYTSRLDIPHQFYGAPMYGEIFNRSSHAALKRIFSDLADPQKYPMYLHCTGGQDRTGTIVFLLQGVLNLPVEDMRREYLLTGYVHPVLVESNHIEVIISGLEPYEGDTVQEKIVTFLKTEVGVTEQELASIREIFLED